MPARAAVFELLSTDPQLTELGVEEVYPTSAVDEPRENCFLVISWGEDDPRSFGQKARERFTIWAHDKDQDYGRIDRVLDRVRAIFEVALHYPGGDGKVLTQADWNRYGPDLYDEGYKTVTRWAEFTGISRTLSP